MPLDLLSLRLIYIRRIVVTLAHTLGWARAMAFARWLARGVFDLNTPARRRAADNLSQAYGDELTPEQRDRLARDVFEHIAAFWVEAFFARRKLRISSWRRFVSFDDEPAVRSLAESPRGALLVTAYLGNLAVGAYALGQVCRPLYVVIDEAEHPVLRSWQDELYRQPNLEFLPRQRAGAQTADLLSAGQKVLIVGEHPRRHGRAIELDYLGQSWPCYPTVGVLARWCNVPVHTVAARRLPGEFRFAVSVGPAVDPVDLADGEDPAEAITQRYMAGLEAAIRRWPDQYLWTHGWGAETARAAVAADDRTPSHGRAEDSPTALRGE